MIKQPKRLWKDMDMGERIGHVIIYLVSIGVVLGLPIWFIVSILNTPDPEPSPFTAELGNSYFVDPSTRKVDFIVTNNSNQAQKASCYLNVQNSGGTYSGSDIGITGLLSPLETKTFNLDITISNEGAAYITEGYVDCQVK